MQDQTVVRLTAKLEVSYGEDVFICGSVPNLGSWNVDKAAPMTCSDENLWVLEAPLPCGVRVELKLVVRAQGGQFSWLGVGEGNFVLETSLGRIGARPSHFDGAGALPFHLAAEDVGQPTDSCAAPEEDALAVRQKRANQVGTPPTEAGPSAPPTEAQIAALLAGQAMNIGRAVQYTTTTVTTTAVTVAGECEQVPTQMGQPVGMPQRYAPPGYSAHPSPAIASCRDGVSNGQAQQAPSHQPALTEVQQTYMRDAWKHNANIPRMGPVALAWPACGAEKVHVQGSWDDWASPLAMDPAPGGGWRLCMVLPPGEYECKFIVDGRWTISDDLERTTCANGNNIFQVNAVALAPAICKASKLAEIANSECEVTTLAVQG